VMESSLYTRAATHPKLTGAVAVGVIAGVAAIVFGRRLV